MAAVYPGSIPTKDPAGALLSSNPHSALHNNMFDEIVAIATELGTNPAGSGGTEYTTVDNRIYELFEQDWVDLTPTTVRIDGGATTNIANTVDYAKGRKVRSNVSGDSGYGCFTYQVTLTAGAAGTGAVKVYHPATFNNSGSDGICTVYDSSANIVYRGYALSTGAGYHDVFGDGGSYLGAAPAITLASGDVIRITTFGGTTFF